MADLADLWSKLYHISSLASGSKPKYPNKQLKMFSNMDELVKESEHNHELRKLLNFGTFLAGGIGLHANIVAIKEVVVDKQEDASYTIATAWKSKGLEFDIVIIEDNLLNLEQEDKTVAEILVEGQLLNVLYVAVTRSRANLSMPIELHEVLANASVLRSEYMELVG
jgi:ATP-dependent exoDNAse (exonuclease V) beta subunit